MALHKVVLRERFDDGVWEVKTYLVEAPTKLEAEAKMLDSRKKAKAELEGGV